MRLQNRCFEGHFSDRIVRYFDPMPAFPNFDTHTFAHPRGPWRAQCGEGANCIGVGEMLGGRAGPRQRGALLAS